MMESDIATSLLAHVDQSSHVMGAFATAVEIFAAQGIGVIPTRHDTPAVPMVKHPDRLGARASRLLAQRQRFSSANAAIWTGPHSRLTIVDIDSADSDHITAAIRACGDTPLKVSTPSGGLHLYYQHGGEQRQIRPFGKDLPLDLLGNGLAVVPPSLRVATGKKVAGQYRVVEGNLALLDHLPLLRAGAMPGCANRQLSSLSRTPDAALRQMREGDGRDNALFKVACCLGHVCATEQELINMVLTENRKMAEPLTDNAAMAKAASAWRYKEKGKLFGKGMRMALGTRDEVLLCTGYPPALVMLSYLRCSHSLSAPPFAIVPEAIGRVLHMCRGTARKARDFLERIDRIEKVATGGRFRDGYRPNLYRLKP
jgi:hypothetical protein